MVKKRLNPHPIKNKLTFFLSREPAAKLKSSCPEIGSFPEGANPDGFSARGTDAFLLCFFPGGA